MRASGKEVSVAKQCAAAALLHCIVVVAVSIE